ncbi:DUF2189 domain-containing protein [Alteraurantiacibacter aestuarii]|uniref:DUF2189 domain-containing protein n=1 Tax=Alteraurantiacibacter aestuarii TaxID=650004 RepID=UPI0031D42515
MASGEQVQIMQLSVATDLKPGDLGAALNAGWRDFLAHPKYGLFFAAIYVATGLFLYFALVERGEIQWLIGAVAGFPLIAPFAAAGLYEVSRRREAGLPLSWKSVLGALLGRGDEQLLLMGGLVFIAFSFWLMVAHGIFAIFMSGSNLGADWIDLIYTQDGLMMLLFGSVIGGAMAMVFYAVTVFSLPMLVDRDVDVITAIVVSIGTVLKNAFTLMVWAAVVAVMLLLAILPFFLGLLVVLPVLGHATWHLYRRAVARAD